MPRGDGTGPPGGGPGQGRRAGQGRGFGVGPSGHCVCPACGEKVAHERGVPCYSMKCPKCGKPMVRGD